MPPTLANCQKQAADLWKKLSLQQRVAAISAGALVIGALIAVSFWSGHTDYALLYGRLDNAEAGKITSVLADSKTPYRIGSGGDSIYVPVEKVHTMRMQLAAKGLPKGDGVGFEIFDKPAFGISDFVQRANYGRAVQGELARTISQLDGVDAARVMIVMPENRLLLGNNREATASVFLRMKSRGPLPPDAVHAIQFLVANSVEGLQPHRVSVVDNRGNSLSENNETDSFAGAASTQLAARQKTEAYLSQKAQSMLEKVLGPGQAIVRVSVDIDNATTTRNEERYDPKSQVIRTSTVNNESTDTATANNPLNMATGVAANVPAADTNATAAATNLVANTSHTRKTVENTQYEISKITSNTVQAAGGIARVTAAVFVAARTTGSGPDRKPAPRTTEELEKLRRVVQSALGLQVGEDMVRKDEINLEEMPFNDWFAAADTTGASPEQNRNILWSHAWKAGCGALALLAAFLAWRLWRRPAEEPSAMAEPTAGTTGTLSETPLPGMTPAEQPLAETQQPIAATGAFDTGAVPSMMGVSVEDLNRMLREDPNKLTGAMRLWLDEDLEMPNGGVES
jgi:flagellar M-ring protein FliF